MQVEGLTIQHVKSHLQKIRLQQQQQQQTGGGHMHGAGAAARVTAPRSAAHRGNGQQPRGGRPLEEEMDPVTGALANQLLLQQELFEHLNAQRQLQAALESHAAQLNALVAAQQATSRDPSNVAVAAAAATAQAAAAATARALSLQHQQQMAAATGDGGGMLHPHPLVMSPFGGGHTVGGGGIDPSGGLPPLFPAGLGLSASPPTLGGATHGAWGSWGGRASGFGADM
jgi:hypothetical protein